MLSEAMPRLAVRLRSIFPDAKLSHISNRDGAGKLYVSFQNHPEWIVETASLSLEQQGGQFQFFESSLTLQYASLQSMSEDDFHRFIAAENLGLRGVTVLSGESPAGGASPVIHGQRTLVIRAGFVGQKGRTTDESENLAIDILSIVRFARLLEDRVLRSSGGHDFCYEAYHSQYIAAGRGRNRYINYARSVFQGSTDRVFGQISEMLKADFRCIVNTTAPNTAKVTLPAEQNSSHNGTEIILRVPDEIPMITCFAPLHLRDRRMDGHESAHENGDDAGRATRDLISTRQILKIVSQLNIELRARVEPGHFEVSHDGSFVSFVTWKHLTNDLRLYSLDYMITSIARAEKALAPHLVAKTDLSQSTSSQVKKHANRAQASKGSEHPLRRVAQ
jgi:hypothetical protein